MLLPYRQQADELTFKADVCRVILAREHRITQAFFQDMSAHGIIFRTAPSHGEHGAEAHGQESQTTEPSESDSYSAVQTAYAEAVDNGTRDDPSREGVGKEAPNNAACYGDPASHGHFPGNLRNRGSAGSSDRVTLTFKEGTDPDPPPPGAITRSTLTACMPSMVRLANANKWSVEHLEIKSKYR